MIERKKRRNDRKKKIQTKGKNKKRQNRNDLIQCPHCSHQFSSMNDVYNIHLSQCKIIQESIAISIDQESSDTPRAEKLPLHYFTKEYKQHPHDFGCFTSRLSRIDIKHCYRGDTLNMNTPFRECPHTSTEEQSKGRNEEPLTKMSETIYTKANEDSYQLYEKAWSLFETVAKSAFHSKVDIEFCHIPFPPDSLDSDGLYNHFGLSLETPLHLKRARIRKLLIRWHPDKFLHSYGFIISSKDLPKVVERVNGIVQCLTKLKATI